MIDDAAVAEEVAHLATDPGWRRLVETARAWGTSPSRFLGREPARVSRTAVDASGDLVERTTVEAEWTDDDRTVAVALSVYEAGCCPGCRRHLAETTDPEAEERFLPAPPTRCHYCTAVEQSAAAITNAAHPRALLFTARDARDHQPETETEDQDR